MPSSPPPISHPLPPLWPSRESHLSRVSSSLRHPSQTTYLWGGTSTGKKTVLSRALANLSPTFASHTIDCALCPTPTSLLTALHPTSFSPTPSAAPRLSPAALSSSGLIAALDAHLADSSQPPLALIFERAERLRGGHLRPELVALLLELPRLVKSPDSLRVVFCSRVAWRMLRDALGLDVCEPRCVYFEALSEDELVKHLVEMARERMWKKRDTNVGEGETGDRESDREEVDEGGAQDVVDEAVEERLFPGYAKAVVTVLFPVTRDLKELLRTTVELYPTYLEPLKADPTLKPGFLWPRFNCHIGTARRMIYHRELVLPNVGAGQSESEGRDADANDSLVVDEDPSPRPDPDPRGEALTGLLQLGSVPRLLLLATFLAVNNPPTHDLHYFSLHVSSRSRPRGGKSRGGKTKSRVSLARAKRKGSTAVPLNRIIAIFDALQGRGVDAGVGESVRTALSSAAFVNMSSLISLGLVSRDRAGVDEIAGDAKFTCNIALETARDVAASVDVSLNDFLHVDTRL